MLNNGFHQRFQAGVPANLQIHSSTRLASGKILHRMLSLDWQQIGNIMLLLNQGQVACIFTLPRPGCAAGRRRLRHFCEDAVHLNAVEGAQSLGAHMSGGTNLALPVWSVLSDVASMDLVGLRRLRLRHTLARAPPGRLRSRGTNINFPD